MSDGLLRMVPWCCRSVVYLLLVVGIELVFCWECWPMIVAAIGLIDCVVEKYMGW